MTKQVNAVFDNLNKEKKSVTKKIFLEVEHEKQLVNFFKVTYIRRRVIL
ncbi:MAG: hypothetical protein O4861_18730 [Trichodesmium sp. St16_bin4-tuft]|nr:hypothetical protein [Trichodesmium sp. St5_bin8]MDE5079067.1 hypothetical protein [Trichodesmium sp. St2_bin6]MDE5092006.1 hypothetical protein [Trichodesmium sp. St18_bin3_1_1]MDE5100253.1 hypothetical protein [Trichodesmium sp. St16_bin4-tuft]MDE5105304.1 hypothetical protein [Trichodesmium sp. St19_bin2]